MKRGLRRNLFGDWQSRTLARGCRGGAPLAAL